MRTGTRLVRELTLGAIDGVARYYERMESLLHEATREERQEIRTTVLSMGLEREAEWAEWDLAMQEHEITFEMLLPNFLRYSCIVLLFLVVEERLSDICRAASSVRSIDPPRRPKAGAVKQCETYLTEEVGITGAYWEAVHDLNVVRNCIVHASGKVEGSRWESRIRQLARTEAGLSVSSTDDVSRNGLEPLYLENGMLMLRPEYCRSAIRNMHDLLEGLCDAMPLLPFVIDSDVAS